MENKSKKSSRIKTEILILLVSFLIALAFIFISAFTHGDGMAAVWQQLHLILLGGLAVYVLYLFLRLIFWGVLKLVK